MGRHPNPAMPVSYAKVTMGSVAEASQVGRSLPRLPQLLLLLLLLPVMFAPQPSLLQLCWTKQHGLQPARWQSSATGCMHQPLPAHFSHLPLATFLPGCHRILTPSFLGAIAF